MSTEACPQKTFGVVSLYNKTRIFEFEFQGICFELFINTLPVVVGTSSNKRISSLDQRLNYKTNSATSTTVFTERFPEQRKASVDQWPLSCGEYRK